MRILTGVLWALGGAGLGGITGAMVAVVISTLTHASNREGAQGYFTIALGLVGTLVGGLIGLVLYGRSAPTGQGAAYAGSGVLGLVGLVAAVALALWAFMNLREAPLKYDGAMANLELELRLATTAIPSTHAPNWLDVEVQTATTRPAGTVMWSSQRIEGAHTIIPVVQGPFYRSGNRVIVVRIAGKQDEAFMPPMKRTPNPKAEWSDWYRPRAVDPPYGVVPKAPLQPIFELRYRVRAYGD